METSSNAQFNIQHRSGQTLTAWVNDNGTSFSYVDLNGVLKAPKIGVHKSTGYAQVNIAVDGKQQQLYMHRLVACAFLGLSLSDSHLDVHHCDEDTLNNSIDNLAVCTRAAHKAIHAHKAVA